MLPVLITSAVFLLSSVGLIAQSNSQLPAPTAHINDFAGVVDANTRNRLEGLLQNLKDKTKIEFYLATVDTTEGRDIFDFSRELASNWNIGARNSGSKSLLLVIAIASKTSFAQFSRLVQGDLPEGVLGEMSQRMRSPLNAGRFSEAIDQGLQMFVNAVGRKMGLTAEDLNQQVSPPAATRVGETTNGATQQPEVEPPKTRPRVVKETSKPVEKETATQQSQPEVKPAQNETQPATETKPVETETVSPPTRTVVKTPKTSTAKKTAEPIDDEAEAEEVELTLTLPLGKRAEKLKTFLETHPDSKARLRATELLISSHAGLGDQYLKSGDIDKGIQQLMLAIDEAEVTISDKLFSGVIAQIPSNLYLRNQGVAAFKAATTVEAKFGSDPKRLLTIAGFYLGIERGDEVSRLAELAVKAAPDLAEAHRILALGRHMSLQLEEAATEYKRTIELDPASRLSRSSLADLTRATGKPEEALAIYNELLKADPKDRNATTGMVLCLFDLGRKEEAASALDAALTSEPRNLALLSGAAYWFAAHEDYEKAIDFAKRAITIEPRYTWAQIALVRSLIGLKRPLGAERAMRFARQYGKFPTLNYELANVVATMGFYDEAAEILRESFTFRDGAIETLLAGRIPARNTDFIDLLAPERRASIYQTSVADTVANSKMLKNLLALDSSLTTASDSEKVDDTLVANAARDFSSGNDPMRAYRQLYAASRLLRKTVALPTALELASDAKKDLDTALDLAIATSAVQADELRGLRAQAIAVGDIPSIADAPRSALSKIMRGRIEDLTGWILFNQDKYPEAIEHLRLAADTLPNGTPSWRNAVWHLGVALEQTGSNNDALESYIGSYNSGPRDPMRRAAIEKLYRKVNGSLDGLDDKIGPATATSVGAPATSNSTSNESPRSTVASDSNATPVTNVPTAEKSITSQTSPGEPVSSVATPTATPEPTPSPTTAATPTTSDPSTASQPAPITEEALRAAGSRLRSTIKITGRVLDPGKNGLPNVTVVLISPSGSVLAATTDNDGNYSFTVTPSQKTYRVIPSKDGYTFSPVDKAFVGLIDDQKEIDFTGSIGGTP
jgi:tetratricopeptide (TPR) repeat protein